MAFHHIPLGEAFLPPKQTILPAIRKVGMISQFPPQDILWLDEVESTHNLLKALLAENPESAELSKSTTPNNGCLDERLRPFAMTAARRQTAGRGQRGNSWESEDFKNLTFSMPCYPANVPPMAQFSISEAVALAIVAFLQSRGITARVKWPNDIYVGDKKICGILIDHSICGSKIQYSVLSAGLNINQTVFRSDAPNPVSMKNITGLDFDIENCARDIRNLIIDFLTYTDSTEGRVTLHQAFMENLYRHDGRLHPFRDLISDEVINAEISDVSPAGILSLSLADGERRTFAFKEVAFLPE